MTTEKTVLSTKIAELRQLKLEEDALRKLSTQMRDQINRLKVEELTLKSQLREREIQLSTASHGGEIDLHSSINAKSIQVHEGTTCVSQVATTSKWEADQKVNKLIDLDLEVPSSPLMHISKYSASSDEEFDEDECLLKL